MRRHFYIQGLVMVGQGISQSLIGAGLYQPSLADGLLTLVLGIVLWFYGSR